jgi:biotin operon repressor
MSINTSNPFVQFDIEELLKMSKKLKSLMAFRVYCCLIDDVKTQKVIQGGIVTYVSASKLAKELKCSNQTIYNALKELKRLGYILHVKGQHKYILAENPFKKW